MSRPLSFVLWGGALAACDGSGSNFVPSTDSGDTDPHTGADTDPDTTQGTQVGSEGFWGCPIDGMEPLDPYDPLPDFGIPAELADSALGGWSLSLTPTGKSAAPGTLSQAAVSWSLVRSHAPCADHVVVGVSGTVDLDGAKLGATGYLGLRPGEAAYLLTLDDPSEAVATEWGLPAPPAGQDAFRLSLAVADAKVTGVGAFAACGPTEVACAGASAALDVVGTR